VKSPRPAATPRVSHPILLGAVAALAALALVLGALLLALPGSGGDSRDSLMTDALDSVARGDYGRAEAILGRLPRGDAEARAMLDSLVRRRNTLTLAEGYRDRGEYDRALELVDGLLLDSPQDATARAMLDSVVAAKRGADAKRAEAERLADEKQQKALKDGLASLGSTITQTRDRAAADPEATRRAAEDAARRAAEDASRKAAEDASRRATDEALKAAENATRAERARVDTIGRLNRQAADLVASGKYSEARAVIDKLLEADPDSALGKAYLGYTLTMANPRDAATLEQAIQLLTRSIQQDPSLWQPHAYLAQIYEKNNDTTNALREYKEAARLNPSDFEIQFAMGKLQYNARQFEDAARSFGAAAAISPKEAKAHFNKGMSLLQLQDYPKALQAFQLAAGAQPDYAKAYFETGKILWKQNQDVPRALAAFRSAVRYDPRNAGYLRNLGEILSASGSYREAESTLAQALAIEPGHAETNYNLAIVKMGLGAPRDAVAYAKAAVDASPSTARYNFQLGLAYETTGDAASAIRYYGLAAQHDPAYVPPLVNLGKLYDEAGRYDEALAVLLKATQLSPEDFAGNNNLGNAYAHKGLYQQAMERFQAALRSRPTAATTRYNLGLAHAELGRDAEAKQDFLDVLKIDPAYWDAYLKLARLLVKEGDKQSAKSFLQTLLDKNPRYEKRDEATKLLGQL
jgi:tetratricopeptide (TPR) repeat protein